MTNTTPAHGIHEPTHHHQHGPGDSPQHVEGHHGGDDGHGAHGHGHDAHRGGHAGHAEMFRRMFWANLVLAVPVLVFSDQIQQWFGYRVSLWGASWIAPVLGTVIYLYGGRPAEHHARPYA